MALDGQSEAAILMLRNYLKDLDSQTFIAPQQPQMIKGELGVILRRSGQTEEAAELLDSVVNSGVHLKEMELAVRELRLAYFELGDFDKLNKSLQKDLKLFRRLLEPRSLILANRLESLADEVVRFEKYAMAEEFLDECVGIYRQNFPDGMEHWMAELKLVKIRLQQKKSEDVNQIENARARLLELNDLMTPELNREFQGLIEDVDNLVDD